MRSKLLVWIYAITLFGMTGLFSGCFGFDVPVDNSNPVNKPDQRIILPSAAITDTTELRCKNGIIDINYYRVNFTYPSVGIDGETPTTLSAALVFSPDVYDRKFTYISDGKKYDSSGLVLSCHFTITSDKEAPTKTKDMQIEGPLMAMGGTNYIFVVPDFSGFGVTSTSPQAYLQADVAARQGLDALEAAKSLLSQKAYNYGPHAVMIGYSQGAHTAMAIQRYESKMSVKQRFELTCVGGGPYDIAAMVDSLLLPGAKSYYPCAIGLIFVGQNESNQLGMDYNQVFRSPLNKKLPDWINSKKMTTDVINDSIYKVLGTNKTKGALVSDILNTAYVRSDNSELRPFFDCVKENSLVSDWTPSSEGRFFIYHSNEDQVVPYYCFEHLNELFSSKGIVSPQVDTKTGMGQHVEAASDFVLSVIFELSLLQ